MLRRCSTVASSNAITPMLIVTSANSLGPKRPWMSRGALAQVLKELVDGEPERNQRRRRPDPGQQRAVGGQARAIDRQPGRIGQVVRVGGHGVYDRPPPTHRRVR